MIKSEENPWYKDIADLYWINLFNLKIIHVLEEVADGYCVLECKEKEYASLYLNKKIIADGDDFYVYRFLILRLFIDKYSTGKYELPKLTELRVVGQSEEEAIKENDKIMEIMLRPLDTYENLLDRLTEAENELDLPIFNLETFDGSRSQEKSLSGGQSDWEDPHYRVYKPAGEDSWDVFYAVERGNGRLQFMFRIYGRKYLHEYILNNHIGAVR